MIGHEFQIFRGRVTARTLPVTQSTVPLKAFTLAIRNAVLRHVETGLLQRD
jgi:hypothetical protein